MKFEILRVPNCPNAESAASLFVEAARLAEFPAIAVVQTIIETLEQAEALRFVGSPSFAVDGVDLFPVPGAEPGVTCRVYSTAGGFSGVPEVMALRDALLQLRA